MQTINFQRLELKDGERFLDVGCGEGRHTIGAYLHANVEAIGVDLSENDPCHRSGTRRTICGCRQF